MPGKKGLLRRKINGNWYYGGPWFSIKSDAQAWANKIRKKDFLAVVVPGTYNGKNGYRVMDRPKFMNKGVRRKK